MKKYYKVFRVDTCFEEYAMNEVLVGAESAMDLVEHIKDVFPDIPIVINEYCIDEYPERSIGDEIFEPQFTDKQFDELCDLNGEHNRIEEVKNLFTDTPYTILDSYGYIE